MILLTAVLAVLCAAWVLAFFGVSGRVWTLAMFVGALSLLFAGVSGISLYLAFGFLLVFAMLVNFPQVRRRFLTQYLYKKFRTIMPPISSTEREAIDAGDIWWEGELFRGCPNWNMLFDLPAPRLTAEEQEFLNTKVDTLCAMVDDWAITHHDLDIPKEVWEYLKSEKFFGMIIPKEYGGLGFSALANSTVIQKLCTRSLSVAVTAMVPNSLGPAELLLAYGTPEQKEYYLPRLAVGQEIPCFALTGSEAGSDAGAIPDTGIVCRGQFQGQEIIGISLTWNKRYITLAPVATVLGLAFKMRDPDGILGDKKDIGITLCLLPTNTPGVKIGKRHFPMNQGFLNGPTQGDKVFIPLDWIIGGVQMAGKGWGMLVECLSAGRGISLPAVSTAAAKHAYRCTGAYAYIRKQFNTSIGRFEGVEAALSRIAGMTYLLEATRLLTLTAIDRDISPGVATAIAKYHLTELSRQVSMDAMDIHGGRGIMLGPHNYLARMYQGMPISVTVEGANILTRSLMIFGQGAIRCHPYLRPEMQALGNPDAVMGLRDFDKILCQHIRYSLSNFARALFHSLTLGWLCSSYPLKPFEKYIRQLNRMSLSLACVADITLLCLGGKLKRRERLSARLGDVLSYLYLASATLKYYKDFGNHKCDALYTTWVLKYCLMRMQRAFYDFFHNFRSVPGLGKLLKFWLFPFGRAYLNPSDSMEHKMVQNMMSQNHFRDRITSYCYQGSPQNSAVGQLEETLKLMLIAEPAERKIENAQKQGQLSKKNTRSANIQLALEKNIIVQSEWEDLMRAEKARIQAIAVDEFTTEELMR